MEDLKQYFDEGVKAYTEGKLVRDCPYPWKPTKEETPLSQWFRGWMFGYVNNKMPL